MLVLKAVVGLVRRSSHGRLRILPACWMGIVWAKSLGVQPIQGIMNFLALLRRTAFLRYADPSWIFALVYCQHLALQTTPGRPSSWPRKRTIALLALAVNCRIANPCFLGTTCIAAPAHVPADERSLARVPSSVWPCMLADTQREVLCAFGVAGLLWQLILVQRQRRGVHA